MTRHQHLARVSAAVLMLIAGGACSDGQAPRQPARISLVSGIGQPGIVGTPLPQPIVVKVVDESGDGVGGTSVQWSVTAGGGSVASASTRADRDGNAQVAWTLGTKAGAQTLTASVSGITAVQIQATAQAGPADSLVYFAGDGQTGPAGSTLLQPIAVRVTDAFGNPASAALVTFTPASGSGAVSSANMATSSTGIAATLWTLGTGEGVQHVSATLPSRSDRTYQFTALAAQPQVTELDSDVPTAPFDAEDNAAIYYRITVPAGAAELRVTTTGAAGDADLYLAPGTLPSPQSYACASFTPFTTETCTVTRPEPGTWYILLHAYDAFQDVILRATLVPGGQLQVNVPGLPAGAAGDIAVIGPDAFHEDLTATTTLGGLAAGQYEISAAPVVHNGTLYTPSPASQGATVTVGQTTTRTVTYSAQANSRNFYIGTVHVTQGVQTSTGTVPLVAGRDGLLRVFTLSSQVGNTDQPTVRVRVYQNGALVDTHMIASASTTVPVLFDDATLLSSWNLRLSGASIRPGMSIRVDVDPGDAIDEDDEDDNAFPLNGSALAPTVVSAPVHRARLVPVLMTGNNLTGDVNSVNVESYLTLLRAIFPLPGVEADVRAPYTFNGMLEGTFNPDWARLLSEIAALRTADGSTSHYYGVVRPNHTSGAAGLGYLGAPAAIGVDWAGVRDWVFAHEVGHNFNREHVDCGNAPGSDPDYPYPSGQLGLPGWDARTNQLHSSANTYDIMSYCRPGWASDYTYNAVLGFRGSAGATAGAPQPALLVWGRITPEGVVLEPAFEVTTRAKLPQRRGPHHLELLDGDGRALLQLDFAGDVIDHMPDVQHFAFAVPLSSLRGRAPGMIRLRGANGREAVQRAATAPPGQEVRATRAAGGRVRLQWDASRQPVLLVRDARSGAVLSFARGGDVEVATGAAEVEVHESNGVRSAPRRLRIDR